ncbi:MAG: GGDEF domain-containing protein [Erysipelotrichaceae bacterium]
MNVLIQIIIILENLIAQFYTVTTCSKKKRKLAFIILVYSLMTIILILCDFYILSPLGWYNYGKGLYFVVAFIFFIPMKYCFRQDIEYLMTLTATTSIYVFFALLIGVRVASILSSDYFYLTLLIVQTIYFLLSWQMFNKFMKKKYVYILRRINKKASNVLLYFSILMFFFLDLINFVFADPSNEVLKLVIILLLGLIVIICYVLFYSLITANKHVQIFKRESHFDSLTNIRNRKSLYENVQKHIECKREFSIFFLDLDNFKDINDEYGHITGDRYLLNFANEVEKVTKGNEFYRISGDEFVILSLKENRLNLKDQLYKLEIPDCEHHIRFLGVSFGIADYPQDGNTLSKLLSCADYRMYEEKRYRKAND